MPALKYLFTAYHDDGQVVVQTEDDTSSRDPSKSTFFDVRPEAVERLVLRGDHAWYGVDIKEDSLSINGTTIKIPAQEKGTLIYFRRNYIERTGDKQTHRIGFHIGIKYSDFAVSIEVF